VGITTAVPTEARQWYRAEVATPISFPVALGDRGRFVVPLEVRERHGWDQGTSLVALDTDAGMLLMGSDDALAWLRSRLTGRDLVAELLADRRTDLDGESA
jgi:bifunctional DNA-binding transcriptional regulator/antitoxin component of YhaV-PrlF toxin-antitoxin module